MAAARVAPEVASQPPRDPAAGLAVPKIVVECPSQPQPQPQQPPAALGRGLPNLGLVKALLYLYLAAAWVACAALPRTTVALRARASAAVDAFFEVVVGALLVDAVVLVVLVLLLLRAALAMGLRLSAADMAKQGREVILWSISSC